MIKAAIFDLDGTLCDTLPDITSAVNHIRKLKGFRPHSESEVQEYGNGDTMELVQAAIESNDSEEDQKMLLEYKKHYAGCYMDKTYAYKGMAEVINELKKRGIKTAVFSNKADEFVKNMAVHYFPGLFDYALGSGIYKSKPNPEGVNVILKEFGIDVKDTVYIGDSDVDVNTARNSGTVCIGVSWGYRGREYLDNMGCPIIVDTPEELLEKILSL